jgi:hypothetical protein
LVWLPGFGLGKKLDPPLQIHNTDKMYVILFAGDVVDCSRHLARVTDHPRLLLGYEVSIPYISTFPHFRYVLLNVDPDLQALGVRGIRIRILTIYWSSKEPPTLRDVQSV